MFDRLIGFVLDFLYAFQPCCTIADYQKGVVLRFGRFNRIAEPGLTWFIPFFVEHVITVTVVEEPMMIGPQSLTTADGRRVVVSMMFINIVTKPRKFLLELEGGNAALLMMAHGVLARFVESRTWADLAKKFDDEDEDKKPSAARSTSRRLAAALQKRFEKYGVEIPDAQITEFTDARSIRLLGVTH